VSGVEACGGGAVSGRAAAPPTSVMNSRRRIAPPRLGIASHRAKLGDWKWSGWAVECPLWVKSRHRSASASCPLYPQKQTSLSVIACPLCAITGPEQSQHKSPLFDHLVGRDATRTSPAPRLIAA